MNSLKKTPLNLWHQSNGGRMVDFAGWEMPVQYEGILAEHKRTREGVSLFDVSHMGELFVQGKDALANLERILPNRVEGMAIGQVIYSPLLNQQGCFVDDITLYKLGEESYMLCVNASNADKDAEWVKSQLQGEVDFSNRSADFGQIAIQGKHALAILKSLCSANLDQVGYYRFVETKIMGIKVLAARMGYTGEDGFEIFCDKADTLALWEKFLEEGKAFGIAPAGLGARDTLRLEVAYPLYGNDIDEKHNALEAGLGRFIKLDKPDFIGRQALVEAKAAGLQQKLVRFVLEGKGVPRSHYPLLDEKGETQIGEITSGCLSPTTGQGIGMGYVPAANATEGSLLHVQIRQHKVPARVIKGAFVQIQK